jgi:hypothetical protein
MFGSGRLHRCYVLCIGAAVTPTLSVWRAQLAAELCNSGAVDGAVLAPFGREWRSADARKDGLCTLSRFICCSVAVESVLPYFYGVVCVDVALSSCSTYVRRFPLALVFRT